MYDRSCFFWSLLLSLLMALPKAGRGPRDIRQGLFWSAHQRFFKCLLIASKVRRVPPFLPPSLGLPPRTFSLSLFRFLCRTCRGPPRDCLHAPRGSCCVSGAAWCTAQVHRTSQLAHEALRNGMCVVIGLQSTGGARRAALASLPIPSLPESRDAGAAALASQPRARRPSGRRRRFWCLCPCIACARIPPAEANTTQALEQEGNEQDDMVSAPRVVLQQFVSKHLFRNAGASLSELEQRRLLARVRRAGAFLSRARPHLRRVHVTRTGGERAAVVARLSSGAEGGPRSCAAAGCSGRGLQPAAPLWHMPGLPRPGWRGVLQRGRGRWSRHGG